MDKESEDPEIYLRNKKRKGTSAYAVSGAILRNSPQPDWPNTMIVICLYR